MAPLPYAFSVHNFISSVGADAGFAAIIGLAILVLLYFAHARETANLREEAALLAARLQQAEARVAELSRPQPVAVPAAEAVQVTDQRGAGLGPFAPAGTGAPALAAATRVVPLAVLSGQAVDDGGPAQPPVAVPAASVAGASRLVGPAASTSTGGAVASPPPVPGGPVSSAAPPAPATSSAAPPAAPAAPSAAPPGAPSASPPAEPSQPASPSGPPPPAMPGPATAAAANGGGPGSSRTLPTSAVPARAPAAGVGPRPSQQLPPLGPPASSGSSRARRLVLAAIALVLVAAAAVALVVITSSRDTSTSSAQTKTTNAPGSAPTSGFAPSAVTVAVLNGTSTDELAHHVAAKLAADGYREGRIATAANQTLPTSVVAYLPGAKNRTDALHVASTLKLRSAAVQPIDQGTRQVACPPPGACAANVVVTVGADLATL